MARSERGVTDGAAPTAGAAASALSRALAEAAGTVTELLEALAGEQLEATAHQVDEAAGPGNALGLGAGDRVVRRRALLVGRWSAVRYLAAETRFAPSRLPAAALRRLATTADPIGRVLADQGLALVRRPLTGPAGSPDWARGDGPVSWFLARRYRLDVGGSPAMDVSEWFLCDLAPLLTGA